MTIDEAAAALTAADLKLGTVSEDYVDIQPEGKIFQQSLAAGAMTAFQSTVDVTVSKGIWTGLDET